MGVIIRQSIKSTLSNYVGIGLAFLSLFLLQPLFYTPRELGAVRLLIESAAVISSFALMGTNYSINRYFPHFQTADRKHHGFFFWAFSIPMAGYLMVLTGLLFFREPLLNLFKKDAALLSPLYPMLIFMVLFSLYQTVMETCAANHGRTAIPNFLREVLLRSFVIISGYCFYKGWLSFAQSLWLMSGAYGLVFLFNIIFIRKLTLINLKPDWQYLRENPGLKKDMIRYTAFLFLGGLTGLIVSKIDFFMVSSMKMLDDTAIYSIGFYLAMLIDIPKRTLLQIATPVFSRHMKANEHHEVEKLYQRSTLNQFMAATILFYLIWINVDNLYAIMPRGDYYAQGKWVVFLIGITRLVDALGASAGPIIANSPYYAWTLLNFGIAMTTAIIANYFLIPVYGINGAAAGTLITFLCTQTFGVSIIYYKLKLHPFTRKKGVLIIIFAIMMGLSFTGRWLENPIIDSVLKTVVLGGAYGYLLYAFQISQEVNSLVNKYLAKFTGDRIKKLPGF
ncbi:MAG: lipopolysaccharide biosynthesis protein [Sphingomonadales bacterium]|nr:lipopolysaccharide biosynthesis protein [Sphingomonadales bacterium]